MKKLCRSVIFICLIGASILFSHLSLAQSSDACQHNTIFQVGVAMHDITGPAGETGMMGYGMLQQKTAGILQRLWARAFIIESPCNGKRLVFVNADLGQIFQGIKQQVIKKLQQQYGDVYTDDNVLLTATHTHSGPGGYSTYAFYNLTTLGFNQHNFNAIVDGIVAAIASAQSHLQAAQIKLAVGELAGITYNRSPTSYLLNPHAEREKYKNNIDTEMVLLRFDSITGRPLGLINWFPIHGVSMNNKNQLINGDNKGLAAYLFEKDFTAPFVAAFAQANAGDVSPNPNGHEGGNGAEGLIAIEKAGRPQYEKAKILFHEADKLLTGGIDYRHQFVAMDTVAVGAAYTNGAVQMTCPAAIGTSMLAGTQDGEGIGFQGMSCASLSDNPLLRFTCAMTTTACQGAKPIALQTGLMQPYPWTPNILPLQIFKIGNVVIVATPFELTTMTGRRLKETVVNQLPKGHHVVLSTLANAYAGYVATNEEYAAQRYEAASTHFGPWTAAALQQEFAKLTHALVHGEEVEKGPLPLDLLGHQTTLQTGVWFDDVPFGKTFGAVYQEVAATYQPGDTVKVMFWGAHPNNNYPMRDLENSFLNVEKLADDNLPQWTVIRTDNDWDTTYHWERYGLAYSLITIEWRIPKNMPAGKYRITHFGNIKSFGQEKTTPYQGHSATFSILNNGSH